METQDLIGVDPGFLAALVEYAYVAARVPWLVEAIHMAHGSDGYEGLSQEICRDHAQRAISMIPLGLSARLRMGLNLDTPLTFPPQNPLSDFQLPEALVDSLDRASISTVSDLQGVDDATLVNRTGISAAQVRFLRRLFPFKR
jgi:hypothetical protein